MFNDEKDYSDKEKGKAIIIDFGRTTNNASRIPDECKKAANSMISSDCLSSERIHREAIALVTQTKTLLVKLKEIMDKNTQKLSKVASKLLYPGKTFIESIKEYIEQRVYNWTSII